MNEINHLPAEYYLDLIQNNKPFQMIRTGDGEVVAMHHNGWLHENCDGSKFLDELIEPMKQIFRNQYKYFHCLLDCSFNLEGDWFRQFIEETCPDMPFFDGEIWQQLSFSDRITELIEAIAPYNPCFVGNKHLEKVQYMNGMGDMTLIEIPEINAFKKFNDIFAEVMKEHDKGCRFFMFCAGFVTKPLIDTLFPYIGHDTFMIDGGSCFDPYVGKLTRDGMKYYGFEKFQPFTSLILK